MGKTKEVFFCSSCGTESPKWFGQCPACKEWNTCSDAPKEIKRAVRGISGVGVSGDNRPKKLAEIDTAQTPRINTGIKEFDRVLGGGIVPGSLVLVGGDPGIGKSTLLLQMCRKLCESKVSVLYVSGEESVHQIKLRAQRLDMGDCDMQILCECSVEHIEELLNEEKPQVVIIDSIQTMVVEGAGQAAGSVSQIREATAVFMRLAKSLGITVFIVGHVTKEGTVAGPKTLEHMVDTVLYFEGETVSSYRILRAVKNRFGSTNEIGVFEMLSKGLSEVTDPSKYLLEGRDEEAPGSVVTATIEGTRPVLIEIQALVTQTGFSNPRRTSVGTDYNRVNLLMAVMERQLGISLAGCDAYLNVAGGMKITEPAIDLAIVTALLSSYKNRLTKEKVVVFGEVGLTGEVRHVSNADNRISEAAKMGYEACIIPKGTKYAAGKKIKIYEIGNIRELRDLI